MLINTETKVETRTFTNTFLNVKHKKSACETKDGIRPTDTQNRTFLLDHFKCLKSNLTNWHERTAYEGLCITQLQPTLNKQLKFKKPNLICGCITKIDEYDSLIRS